MVDWTHIPGLAPYPETLAAMEAHVAAMHEGRAGDDVVFNAHETQERLNVADTIKVQWNGEEVTSITLDGMVEIVAEGTVNL